MVNGGTNDLDNNSEKRKSALVHMVQFAQEYVNANVIILNTLLRHDLALDSQISLEIQDFNMKLSKSAKLIRHVELVEINFNRKYFTKHGLHLNNVGKEGLAKSIASQINKIINCLKKKEETIQKVSHTSYQYTVDSEVHDLINLIASVMPLQAFSSSALRVD